MNGLSSGQVLLFVTAVVVCFRAYFLVRRMWNYPLMNGQGYFMGMEVWPRFYDGAGSGWLRSYRTLLLAEHAVEAVALAAILASGRWRYLTVWPVAGAGLFLCTYLGTFVYARHTLGSSVAVPSKVVVPLENRRLGDYLSWPAETVCWTLAVVSWCLLLFGGNTEVRWRAPVILTYGALGLLPLKIAWIRAGIPLPAERTEEHQRWLEAYRRYFVRIMNTGQWLMILVLAGAAVIKGWALDESVNWLRWAVVAIALGTWLAMIFVIVRDGMRLESMGRGLRPISSWASPFQSGKSWCSVGWWWIGFYIGGLIMLLLFFHA